MPRVPNTPDTIYGLFKRYWTGSDDDLDEALQEFYLDVRSSFKLALMSPPNSDPAVHAPVYGKQEVESVATVVDDYISSHYFS